MHFNDGRMRAALAGGFRSDRVALLAELVEDALVFTGIVDAPVSNGHHDAKVQDGTEHQHERDGEVEDQERDQHELGNRSTAPDGGQDPVER